MSSLSNLMQTTPTTGKVGVSSKPQTVQNFPLKSNPGGGPMLQALAAPGPKPKPNPVTSVNDPRFQEAAANGMFGPVTLQQLLDSPEYKALGNNNQAYDGAYQSALAGARANITQSLGAAMTELSNRSAAINAAGAAAPGQIADSYGRANAAIAQNTGAVQGEMSQAQINPNIGPSQAGANAPVLAALAGNEAEATNSVPAVVNGLQTAVSSARVSAQQDAADKLASLDMQAADHQQQANEPSTLQKVMIDEFQRKQAAKQAGDAAAAKQAGKTQTGLQSLQAQTHNVLPSSGAALVKNKVVPGYADQIRGNKGRTGMAYNEALGSLGKALNQLHSSKGDDNSRKAFTAQFNALMKKYPHQADAIKVALADTGMTDKEFRFATGG